MYKHRAGGATRIATPALSLSLLANLEWNRVQPLLEEAGSGALIPHSITLELASVADYCQDPHLWLPPNTQYTNLFGCFFPFL